MENDLLQLPVTEAVEVTDVCSMELSSPICPMTQTETMWSNNILKHSLDSLWWNLFYKILSGSANSGNQNLLNAKLTAVFASTLLECLHCGSLPTKFHNVFPTRHLLLLDQNQEGSCYSDCCFVFFNSSFSVWHASSYFQNVYRNNKLSNNHHCHSFW